MPNIYTHIYKYIVRGRDARPGKDGVTEVWACADGTRAGGADELDIFGTLEKMFIKPWANRMAANTRLAGVCVGAGAVKSNERWQRVGCILCHNVQIYCPVVVCRTAGFSSVLVQ